MGSTTGTTPPSKDQYLSIFDPQGIESIADDKGVCVADKQVCRSCMRFLLGHDPLFCLDDIHVLDSFPTLAHSSGKTSSMARRPKAWSKWKNLKRRFATFGDSLLRSLFRCGKNQQLFQKIADIEQVCFEHLFFSCELAAYYRCRTCLPLYPGSGWQRLGRVHGQRLKCAQWSAKHDGRWTEQDGRCWYVLIHSFFDVFWLIWMVGMSNWLSSRRIEDRVMQICLYKRFEAIRCMWTMWNFCALMLLWCLISGLIIELEVHSFLSPLMCHRVVCEMKFLEVDPASPEKQVLGQGMPGD